jgi:hypothetical protein
MSHESPVEEHLNVGGTRQALRLDNEKSYPLTQEEFLQLQENLVTDKLTNTESFLFGIAISFIVSAIASLFTTPLTCIHIRSDGVEVESVNAEALVMLIVYCVLGLGTLIAGFIRKMNGSKVRNNVSRLTAKINGNFQK